MPEPSTAPISTKKRPASLRKKYSAFPANPLLEFSKKLLAYGGHALRAYDAVFSWDKTSGMARQRKAVSLSRTPTVQDFLAKLRHDEAAHVDEVKQRLRDELSLLAFSRMSDYYDENGDLKPMSELTPAAVAALQEYRIETEKDGPDKETTRQRIKLVPKNEAIQNLMKHYGLIQEVQPEALEFEVVVRQVGGDKPEITAAARLTTMRVGRAANEREKGEGLPPGMESPAADAS